MCTLIALFPDSGKLGALRSRNEQRQRVTARRGMKNMACALRCKQLDITTQNAALRPTDGVTPTRVHEWGESRITSHRTHSPYTGARPALEFGPDSTTPAPGMFTLMLGPRLTWLFVELCRFFVECDVPAGRRVPMGGANVSGPYFLAAFSGEHQVGANSAGGTLDVSFVPVVLTFPRLRRFTFSRCPDERRCNGAATH